MKRQDFRFKERIAERPAGIATRKTGMLALQWIVSHATRRITTERSIRTML
jgi:hypothetical protein